MSNNLNCFQREALINEILDTADSLKLMDCEIRSIFNTGLAIYELQNVHREASTRRENDK
jgi:hypothetical protein